MTISMLSLVLGMMMTQPPMMPPALSTLFGGLGTPGAATLPGSGPAPAMDISSLLDKLVTSGIIKKDPDAKPDASVEDLSTSTVKEETKQESAQQQLEFATKKVSNLVFSFVGLLED